MSACLDCDATPCECRCLDCDVAPCECELTRETEAVARLILVMCPALITAWGDNPNAPAYLGALINDARDVLAWLEVPE